MNRGNVGIVVLFILVIAFVWYQQFSSGRASSPLKAVRGERSVVEEVRAQLAREEDRGRNATLPETPTGRRLDNIERRDQAELADLLNRATR